MIGNNTIWEGTSKKTQDTSHQVIGSNASQEVLGMHYKKETRAEVTRDKSTMKIPFLKHLQEQECKEEVSKFNFTNELKNIKVIMLLI